MNAMEVLVWLVLVLGMCFLGYWAIFVMAMSFMVIGIYLHSGVGICVALWLLIAALLTGE